MQKRKATRAYKMGYTDGLISGKGNNTFTNGSSRYKDYERGLAAGLKDAEKE